MATALRRSSNSSDLTRSAAETAEVTNRESTVSPPSSSSLPPAYLDPEYVWPLGVSALPPDAVQCGPAGAGDHAAVHQLLTAVFQGPTRDDFYSALEDPVYEPCDRLVVKRGAQVLSHLHLAQRVMRFGDDSLPLSTAYRLATLPEYRGRGYAKRLLTGADEAMTADGSVLGLLTTRIPHFFRPSGWVVCMRHSHAQVGSRDLLAQLSAGGFAPHATDEALNIRPWRHVELPSLIRLYQESTAVSYGPIERNEAYWRWLVNRLAGQRQTTDGIFVALAGPKRFDFDFDDAAIVGYCVQRDDRILELVASPKHPGVAERLLARACGEAIERDNHVVRLHLSPTDPLWNVVAAAGGTLQRSEQYQGEVTMVKLLDPVGFLKRLLPVLHQRATAAAIRRPVELGVTVDDLKLRLTVSRRSVKVVKAPIGRNGIKLSDADFTRLLLGHLNVAEAAADGRVQSTNRVALQTAAALFPQVPLWHPPLDDLLV
jgi:GNAT superfamily N-acetyltransferase